jgi:membrane protease YdiL (CAAX protease family)
MSGFLPPIFTDPIPETDLPVKPILPDGEAPPRIPHIGHAILFVAIAVFLLIVFESLLVLLHTHDPAQVSAIAHHPKLLVASEALTYLLTIAASWLVFPLLWKRPFAEGIQWNFPAARRLFLRLVPLGLVLGWTVEAISSLLPMPKTMPIDDFFRTQSDVWLITCFGTLLAPVFEEICFRGFLLPAFAIAYDWLTLARTPEAILRWRQTTTLTPASLVFSGILTSVLFALLHAEQLAHAWAALAVLLCVSLVLTVVRIYTKSVACSAIMHASYNLSVFIGLFLATGGYRHLDKMH